MGNVKPIPDDYRQVTAYLSVAGAAAAVELYVDVFGGRERMRMPGPDGTIGHAEVEIGSGVLMLADEFAEMGFLSPKTIGGTPVMLSLYVEDVDATYAKALAAGATSLREPQNQFYGDRSASFEDPFGHRWSIATHVEDVSPEEMERRAAEVAGAGDSTGA